jgi:hypothetical protein
MAFQWQCYPHSRAALQLARILLLQRESKLGRLNHFATKDPRGSSQHLLELQQEQAQRWQVERRGSSGAKDMWGRDIRNGGDRAVPVKKRAKTVWEGGGGVQLHWLCPAESATCEREVQAGTPIVDTFGFVFDI